MTQNGECLIRRLGDGEAERINTAREAIIRDVGLANYIIPIEIEDHKELAIGTPGHLEILLAQESPSVELKTYIDSRDNTEVSLFLGKRKYLDVIRDRSKLDDQIAAFSDIHSMANHGRIQMLGIGIGGTLAFPNKLTPPNESLDVDQWFRPSVANLFYGWLHPGLSYDKIAKDHKSKIVHDLMTFRLGEITLGPLDIAYVEGLQV